MTKPISWFEIPVVDFDRARTFYETIFQLSLITQSMPGSGTADNLLGVFPYDREQATGGCIMHAPGTPGMEPSAAGTVVYLNASPNLDAVIARVVAAGGRIALPGTALPPGMGFFAHIVDTEGNRVGLHAEQA